MIPRYVPHIALRGWLRWITAHPGEFPVAQKTLTDQLVPQGLPYSYAFDCLRSGLQVYFSELSRTSIARTVLMSAQICEAVPRAVTSAGLDIRFVDIDVAYPTPSASRFAAEIDSGVVAVIVAPLYGHIQSDWQPLIDALQHRALVLDLAQGLALDHRIEALYFRANAVGFSFGLGKGVDTGGGLIFSREPLTTEGLKVRRKISCLKPLLAAVLLQVLSGVGLYRTLLPRIERGTAPQGPHAIPTLLPSDIWILWKERLIDFLDEIELARKRAAELRTVRSLVGHLREPDIYLGAAASHLRQILRLKDPQKRERLLQVLRAAGVDCDKAGEPLPGEIEGYPQYGLYPNATLFRHDAIRLPFLGRMTEAQFQRFRTILERTLGKHLS